MVLFDSHTHLNSPRFEADVEAVWARARAAGVTKALAVGFDLPSSRRAIELARTQSGLYAAVGIHPHHSDTTTRASIAELRELAEDPTVVAVGETGLDYYRNLQARDVQEASFRTQLELAGECGLPVIVHIRDAFADALRVLKDFKGRGVVHCYTGGPSDLAGFLERGLHISFSGVITYPSSSAVCEALRIVPAERLLIETDCPYLTPGRLRNRRNEPAFLLQTAARAAAIRGLSGDELASLTSRNAENLFGPERGA